MEFRSSESPKQCGITPSGFIHIQIQPHNESLAALLYVGITRCSMVTVSLRTFSSCWLGFCLHFV